MINPEKMKFIELAVEFLKDRKNTDYQDIFHLAEEIRLYTSTEKPPTKQDVGNDFKTFLSTTKIYCPRDGMVPFEPYPFQSDLADVIEANRYLLIQAARQMGLTGILLAYAWYYAMENEGSVVVLPFKSRADCWVKCDTMFKIISSSVTKNLKETKNNTVYLNNGSRIMFVSNAERCHGMSIDLLIIDGMLHLPSTIVEQMLPNVRVSSGQVIIASEPGPAENPFRTWFYNETPDRFHRVLLPWTLHPNRDEAWYEKIISAISEDNFRAEYECHPLKKE